MGLVTNTTTLTIGRVNVDVRLYHRDSSLLDEASAGIEQSLIPAGATAPYSLLFKTDWSGYGGAAVSLVSADVALVDDSYVVELPVLDERHSFRGGVYTVYATLHNPGNVSAQVRRAVLTLWDANGNLTGYRVMLLNRQIEAGGLIDLQIDAVSRTGDAIRHSLFIEGERHS